MSASFEIVPLAQVPPTNRNQKGGMWAKWINLALEHEGQAVKLALEDSGLQHIPKEQLSARWTGECARLGLKGRSHLRRSVSGSLYIWIDPPKEAKS